MNNNKVLIKLVIPEIDKYYDILIPVNKKVGNIIELFNKALTELNSDAYVSSNKRCLYNKYSGIRYNFNSFIYETDIRNDTILIFV